MNKRVGIILGVVLVLLVVSIVGVSSRQRRALNDVAGTTLLADAHHVRVVECGKLVLQAEYNYDVITRAAEYVGTLGSSTSVYVGVARIASEADHEVPELAEVLDLAVMKQNEMDRVLALAREAVAIQNETQRTIWRARHASLLATAQYPNLRTALEAEKLN